MVRTDKKTSPTAPEAVISIIGMGMTLTGDCETDGALRVEGTITGNVRAGKAVVIGKDGLVDGNIYTQDAVIAGRVLGCVHAESRLELQSTSQISGGITARRMQLEEGATLQGQLAVGETELKPRAPESPAASAAAGEGEMGHGEAGDEEMPGGPAFGSVTDSGASVVSAPLASANTTASPESSKPHTALEGASRKTPAQEPQKPPRARGAGSPGSNPAAPAS